VTLALLWQEYRAEHAQGYAYSWFCERYSDWRKCVVAIFVASTVVTIAERLATIRRRAGFSAPVRESSREYWLI
jgi:hypothetical protein